MITTTLLFLKSNCSKDRFALALEFIKSQSSRLFLSDQKIWVLDIEAAPGDPAFDDTVENVREEGWSVLGFTLWDASLVPLRNHEKAIVQLAELSIEAADFKKTQYRNKH